MQGRVLLVFAALLASVSFSTTFISGCQDLDNLTDSDYVLSGNLTGANVSGAPQTLFACIRINSSNIVLDCAGFSLNGNSASTTGIILRDLPTNVTVRNCVISNHTLGIFSPGISGSSFINNTLLNSSLAGLRIDSGAGDTIDGNSAFGNLTQTGFSLNTSDTYFANNIAERNQIAFHFDPFNNLGIDNNTILNNTAADNGVAFYVSGNGSNIINNTAVNSTISGFGCFFIHDSTLTASGNNATDCPNGGFRFSSGSNLTVANNTVTNCDEGFRFNSADGNFISGNTVSECFIAFDISSSGNIIENNSGFNTSYLVLAFGSNYTVTDNLVFGDISTFPGGFAFFGGSNITLSGNNVTDTLGFSGGAYHFDTVTDSAMINNTGNNQLSSYYSSNVSFINNTAGNFVILETTNYTFTGNTARDFSNVCFDISSSPGTVSDSVAINCSTGFHVGSDQEVTISNSSATGSQSVGFLLDWGANATVLDSSASGSGTGFVVSSNTTIERIHLFNNSQDMEVSTFTPPSYINATDLIFDSPDGTYANYTNISIYDVLTAPVFSFEQYFLSWSAMPPGGLPGPNQTAFGSKFLNLTAATGPSNDNVSIDSITWHWQDSELTSGDNESEFELWKFNNTDPINASIGNWTLLNDTPDTVANTLSLSDYLPGSVYAIIEPTPPNCPVITTPGLYQMNNSFIGAPNSAFPLAGTACVVINSSDVLFDCNGFGVSDNGTAGTTRGILIAGPLTNVTVKNCAGISSYTYGIESNNANGSLISDNIISNVSNGIRLSGSTFSSITGNSVNTSGASSDFGIMLSSSSDNSVSGNNISTAGSGGSNLGVYLQSSSNRNLVDGNRITTNGTDNNHGIRLQNGAINVTLSDNVISSGGSGTGNFGILLLNNVSGASVTGNEVNTSGTSGNAGIVLETTVSGAFVSGGNVSANTIRTTGTANDYGVYLNINVSDTVVSGNDIGTNGSSTSNHGIFVVNGTGITILGNSIATNGTASNNGIRMATNSGNSTIAGNSISTGGSGGSNHGIYLFTNVSGVNITGNDISASDSGSSGIVLQSSADASEISGNVVTGFIGIQIAASEDDIVSGNAVNASDVCVLVSSSNRTDLSGNQAGPCGSDGFSISSSLNTTLSGDTAGGSTAAGLRITDSDGTSATGIHLFDNSPGLLLNGSSMAVVLSGMIFDSPGGGFANYTNLSISDTVSSSYSIDHATEPLTAPPGDSFAQKYLNITAISGPVTIDSITWHWLDSELGGSDNESDFQLWKYDGAWGLANSSPDTLSNTLSLSGLSGLSMFGIIQNVTVNVSENVSVSKTDATAAPASSGGIVQFNITVSNTGTAPISPNVTDVLPAGLTFVSALPAPASVAGQTINWTLSSIVPGGATVILLNATVDQGAADSGTQVANLTNTVNASAASVSASDSADAAIYYANISVSKTADNSTLGKVMFNFTITNTGNVTLSTVRVVDIPQAGLSFDESSPLPTSVGGGNITWANVGPLAPGANATIFLNLTVSANGTYSNDVTAAGVPPNGADVSANDSIAFNASSSPSLPPSSNNPQPLLPLDINVSNSCEGANITVTSGGSPVEGAHIIVTTSSGATVLADDTDANGEVFFGASATLYRIRASASGYSTAIVTTELGKLACQQIVGCYTDLDCNPSQYCIRPDVEGKRFGPPSTYVVFPALANCVDDELAIETDYEDIGPACSRFLPAEIAVPIGVVTGTETCGSPLDPSYCRVCSDACTRNSDCRGGDACIHPSADYRDIHIGVGSCGLATNSRPSCASDSDCAKGDYCEPIYGICIPGCNDGHTMNCPLGSFCAADGVKSHVDACAPGCQSNDNCDWYQYCNITSGTSGICSDIGCGPIDNSHSFSDGSQVPSNPWQCDPSIPFPRPLQLPGSPVTYNPACSDCTLGKICDPTTNQCVLSCIDDRDCNPGINDTAQFAKFCDPSHVCRPKSTLTCSPPCNSTAGELCEDVHGAPQCVPYRMSITSAVANTTDVSGNPITTTCYDINTTKNGLACQLCSVVVETPSGTIEHLTTDSDGYVQYCASENGNHKITLVGSSGQPAISTTRYLLSRTDPQALTGAVAQQFCSAPALLFSLLLSLFILSEYRSDRRP